MIYVLILAAGLWFLGREMNVPAKARWLMIGLLYVAVLGLLVLRPALAEPLGGSLGEWLLLGALVAVVLGYRRGLGGLRARAQAREAAEAPPQTTGAFQSAELERYARHIMLREIGGPGQKRLKQAKVLVIGAGGLGSPACLYLAAAGVGTIGVIDDDAVESTNLQRQIAHTDARIGVPKVFSAESAMRDVNPFIEVRPYHRRLTEEIAAGLVAEYDLVLDGTDNFDTRYLANRACLAAGVPLISGALTQWEGQISVFGGDGPCYRCVFPEAPAPGLAPSCAEAGVLGPLTGVVGSMMAVEAVKLIAEAGEPLRGRMLIYDALYGEVRVIKLSKRADCPDCGEA
ncbi:Sulfur carrier protein adenylyltransferase ThiF [Candidatus Rhodobacter oscarellae]|uniref:Molybdopterin-synthase adenylyltransferase n=1 Tax=Candidatus Rhodobacter oscarellae TaxID=1675527 RepID=A0A0J9E5I6_9RHOB|nr:HesA/MoeB/ThiF family protein [Candidatus Rhodobacter lobularis]KMW57951.1 Sulfur carrier protein adenylyltransferase ThiF [Candidatus Rhodobacter lobularis]